MNDLNYRHIGRGSIYLFYFLFLSFLFLFFSFYEKRNSFRFPRMGSGSFYVFEKTNRLQFIDDNIPFSMLYRIILIPFFVLCIFDVDLYVVSYSITKVENYDR